MRLPFRRRTEAAATRADQERLWEYVRAHRDRRPYRAVPADHSDGQDTAMAASAADHGDLTRHPGPRHVSSWDPDRHTDDDGTYWWVEVARDRLEDDAHAWLETRLAPEVTGAAAVDAAWELLPRFFADRYQLPVAALPPVFLVLEGSSVLTDDEVSQWLYGVARAGFEAVVGARGGTMVEADLL